MKNIIILSVFLSAFISLFSSASTTVTSGFGILTADNTTQGQLLWLKGRIADASYTFTRQDDKTCVVKVPVAIGSVAEPDVGITTTKGLTIIVMSQRLNEALLQGQPIDSEDWNFTTQAGNDNFDGRIVDGISPSEGFILNSRRRWISWFMGFKQSPICHLTNESE